MRQCDMDGTPYPWSAAARGGRGGGAPASAGRGRGRGRGRGAASSASAKRSSAASGAARRVRFAGDGEDPGVGGRLSLRTPSSARRPKKFLRRSQSSGKKRGRPPAAAAERAVEEEAPSSKKRAKPKPRSSTFADLTFYLSGFGRDESAALAELIVRNGGVVESQIPSPGDGQTLEPFTPSPPAGAPQPVAPDPADYTRVVTPTSMGRTLKCLYASAIGAPVVTPAWVREAAATGNPSLSPSRTPPGSIISRGGRPSRDKTSGHPGSSRVFERIFAGLAFALSGDDGFHAQFGALLAHAGASVVDGSELTDDAGDDRDARCDLVVVQESPAERRGFRGSALRRAAERHGVPCVWHPWAVESLLRGFRQDAGEFAAVK